MPFDFIPTDEIPEVLTVVPRKFEDSRGYFLETYKQTDFFEGNIHRNFVQDNQSYSTKDVVRGIHFQKDPRPQGKLVRCLKGSILDVAVDLRPDSPTYLSWVSTVLSEDNCEMFWVPEGFGHGFSVLSDDVIVQYKCTSEYDHSLDAGIRWDDSDLNIDWKVKDPIISDKDLVLPTLKEFLKK